MMLHPAATPFPSTPDTCSLVALPLTERNPEKGALEPGGCSPTQDQGWLRLKEDLLGTGVS